MIEPLDDRYSPARPAGCLSRFQLERSVAGEIDAEGERRIDGHLETCPACRALRERLEAEKARFQAAVPFEAFLADLDRRLAEAPAIEKTGAGTATAPAQSPLDAIRRWLEALWQALRTPVGVGLVAAAALLVVVAPRLLERPSGDDLPGAGSSGYTGFKSGQIEPGELTVYILRGGSSRAEVATGQARLRAGDRLQFEVRPGSRRYLQLVSVDATGRLSPFYPADGAESMLLARDARLLLPDSIQLDDFVGLERVYAVYSAEPLDRAGMEAAVAHLVRRFGLPLPLDRLETLPIEQTAQASFLLVKE